MTSHNVEDNHMMKLKKLLEESNLVCERQTEEAVQASPDLTQPEEPSLDEMEEEEQQKEMEQSKEEMPEEEETSKPDLPVMFPTPSLRLVLPEKIRTIQKLNCIQVLPVKFKLDFDPAMIPIIADTAPRDYIDKLAEMVGCTKYQFNLPEYWFLDTMANLLRRAQADHLDRHAQAVLMHWFIQWIREVQYFDAADRKRMMKRFEANMISAAIYIVMDETLPTPAECGVYYKAPDTSEVSTMVNVPVAEAGKNAASGDSNTKVHVTFGKSFSCCLLDLTMIIHYIFDLFSSDFQYDLVRSVFTFPPEYIQNDSPYQLQICKKVYGAPQKTKAKKEKTPRPEKAKGKQGKVAIEDINKDYVELMKLKAKEEAQLDEQEEKDHEKLNQKEHILPLSFAVDPHFLDKYWPPPPTPEPEPVAPVTSRKGKK